MAAKKSKKQSVAAHSRASEISDSPLGLLQSLLSMIPDEERLGLLSSLMGGGGPGVDFLSPPPDKPRTQAHAKLIV